MASDPLNMVRYVVSAKIKVRWQNREIYTNKGLSLIEEPIHKFLKKTFNYFNGKTCISFGELMWSNNKMCNGIISGIWSVINPLS